MSNIKSERAREYTLRHLDNNKTAVNIHHVYSAVSIAEQDAEERARKAFVNIMKKFIGLLPVEALEAEFERSLKEE